MTADTTPLMEEDDGNEEFTSSGQHDHQQSSLSPGAANDSSSSLSSDPWFWWWRWWWQYMDLVTRNPGYRLYLISHVCQDMGDWFVKIGAYLAVQRISNVSSGSAISYLMLTIMLPQVFLAPFGGVLADSGFDRRRIMLVLDVASGIIVFGYLLALHQSSVPLLYAVSTLRTSIASLYDPVTRSILPMIVNDSYDLKRAVSINYIAWNVVRILGGLLAGLLTASLGMGFCFVVDSITYFLSAAVLFFLRGDFRVVPEERRQSGDVVEEESTDTGLPSWCTGLVNHLGSAGTFGTDVFRYLSSSGLVCVVFLRLSGATVWGWADVLNVSYAHVDNNEALTSKHLGILMISLGSGCLVGPMLANFVTDPEKPRTLLIVWILGITIMALGWIGIDLNPRSFWRICVFSGVRTVGASILICNSLLLIQRVVKKEFLGRVLALEFALTMLMDSLTNWTAGKLHDEGIKKEQISTIAIILASVWAIVWTMFEVVCGGGKRLDDAVQGEVDALQTPLLERPEEYRE